MNDSLDYTGFPGAQIFHFSHKAMNTLFEIFIKDEKEDYAEQAAYECFKEIDRLEEELSKFKPNSEISRLNNCSIGESIVLNEDVFSCLQECEELYKITHGYFDITAGRIINRWKEHHTDEIILEESEIFRQFPIILKTTDFSAVLLSKIEIDLGGVGKGYAVDKCSALLREWEISSFLISGGKSTVYGEVKSIEQNGWPVSVKFLTEEINYKQEVLVKGSSISSSGLEKGSHIVNPITGEKCDNSKCWVYAKKASWTDALSTAFMILDKKEIEQVCCELEISALLLDRKNRVNIFGEFFPLPKGI